MLSSSAPQQASRRTRVVRVGGAVTLGLLALYGNVEHLRWRWRARELERYELIRPQEAAIDVVPMLAAHSIDEYARLRQRIVAHVWKGQETFRRQATFDERQRAFASVPLAGAVTRLTIEMEGGVRSRVHLLRTRAPAGCLALYHSGHSEGILQPKADAAALVNAFLERGCDVLHFSMPLQGDNAGGMIRTPAGATVKAFLHDVFRDFETDTFSPIKYFVEPVLVSLNHAMAGTRYSKVAMVGRSGGGWTTVLAAAIDPRITAAYPVAGAFPMYLRKLRPPDLGDWEQSRSTLYTVADYTDLFTLMSLEPGRRSLHIYNEYDTCCFQGAGAYAFFPQLIGVARRMGISGLAFHVNEERDAHHDITASSRQLIIEDFFGI